VEKFGEDGYHTGQEVRIQQLPDDAEDMKRRAYMYIHCIIHSIAGVIHRLDERKAYC
jgi:hypothetical protein